MNSTYSKTNSTDESATIMFTDCTECTMYMCNRKDRMRQTEMVRSYNSSETTTECLVRWCMQFSSTLMYNYIKEITDFAIACWIFDWILMKTDAEMIGTGTDIYMAVQSVVYRRTKAMRCNYLCVLGVSVCTHTNARARALRERGREKYTFILASLSIQWEDSIIYLKLSVSLLPCCFEMMMLRRLLSNLNAKQQQQQKELDGKKHSSKKKN